MADIRINALTEASASVTTDFLPIDGSTGTRKLSAYSPSFGGNVTISGTLSTTSIVNNGGNGLSLDTVGSASLRFTDSAASKWWIYKLNGDSNLYFRDMVNARMQMYMTPNPTAGGAWTTISSNLAIEGTTASTGTSSGALVVSGGVGVAGNTYVGGDLVVASNSKGIYSQGYVTVKGQQANFLSRGTDGGWTCGMHFYSSNTDYSASIIHLPYSGDLQFYTNSTSSNYTSSDIALQITTAKQVQAKGVLIADAASNAFRITTAQTPASATATGTAGTIAWDTSYVYVCTATNTWKRTALSTW